MKDRRNKNEIEFLLWALTDPKRPMTGMRLLMVIQGMIVAAFLGMIVGSVIVNWPP